jgi:hypothetical protein
MEASGHGRSISWKEDHWDHLRNHLMSVVAHRAEYPDAAAQLTQDGGWKAGHELKQICDFEVERQRREDVRPTQVSGPLQVVDLCSHDLFNKGPVAPDRKDGQTRVRPQPDPL